MDSNYYREYYRKNRDKIIENSKKYRKTMAQKRHEENMEYLKYSSPVFYRKIIGWKPGDAVENIDFTNPIFNKEDDKKVTEKKQKKVYRTKRNPEGCIPEFKVEKKKVIMYFD
jgi:hypothetical protein